MNRTPRTIRTLAVTAALALGVWTLAVTFTPIASSFSAGAEVSASAFNDLFAAIDANFDTAAAAITANEDAVAALQAPEAVSARIASDETVNNNSVFAVPFDFEAFDIGDFHSTTTNQTQFVVPRDGIYRISAALTWSANSAGDRTMAVRRNNTTVLGDSRPAAFNTVISQSTGGLLALEAGDVIDVLAIQDSGSALTLLSTAQVYLDMNRIGDLP